MAPVRRGREEREREREREREENPEFRVVGKCTQLHVYMYLQSTDITCLSVAMNDVN